MIKKDKKENEPKGSPADEVKTSPTDWEERFEEKFANDYYGKHGQGLIKLRDLTKAFFKSEIAKAKAETRREVISKIKFHFETMVFDDISEDKLVNIMEFRKKQSDYLNSLDEGEKSG